MLRSPLLQSLLAILFVFAMGLALLPSRSIVKALDYFAISACAIVLIRFSPLVLAGFRQRQPSGAQILVVSIAGVALAIGVLRALRTFGLELGLIETETVAWVFALTTALMVWAICLKIVAPPIGNNRYALSPFAGIVLAAAGGAALWAIASLIRWWGWV